MFLLILKIINLYQFFLVECKAPNVSLTDKVFQQVRKYDEIIYANTVAITNGKYFIIKSWDQETKIYRDLEELPTYKDLVNKKDLVFDKTEYNPWKRPEFKDKYDDCTIKEFIDYQWIGVDTPKKLYPFLINLAGCIQDDTEKLKPQIINGIKIIKDGGIRYTEYGNAGGGRLTGLYRYFIIEDDEGNNQIISMTTMGLPSLKDHPTFGNQRGKTTLIVAIDDYENSHNSLELNLDRYLYKEGNKYTIYHDGAMTVGNRGRVKNKEVIHFIKSKEPCLVKGNKIFLGCFDNNKEIKINQNLTKEFFGNIIKYALLRDEFRKIKKS